MSVQWYYKRVLRGYTDTHVLQTRNRKLYVTRELTEQGDGKESTRRTLATVHDEKTMTTAISCVRVALNVYTPHVV